MLSTYDLRSAFDTMVPSFCSDGATSVAPQWLTIPEAATYLNRNILWVRRVLRYELPIYQMGRRIYFARKDLDHYMDGCRRVPPKNCSVDGCERAPLARGLCKVHLGRVQGEAPPQRNGASIPGPLTGGEGMNDLLAGSQG